MMLTEKQWKIKTIFDGEFGCEERPAEQDGLMVSVTLIDEDGNERYETVPDAWLLKNGLDVGNIWLDYSHVRLETEDLILQKAKLSDWKDIYQNLWCHAESARYMLWKPAASEKEAIERMKRTVQFQKYHKYALFLYEKSSGQAIGFAGMKETEPGIIEDTGIAIGPNFTGRGYGTQVLVALTQEARRVGATKFIASCRTQNHASHELQVKCGFEFLRYEERVDPRNGQAYLLEFNQKELRA